jgi:hypothetical protein
MRLRYTFAPFLLLEKGGITQPHGMEIWTFYSLLWHFMTLSAMRLSTTAPPVFRFYYGSSLINLVTFYLPTKKRAFTKS